MCFVSNIWPVKLFLKLSEEGLCLFCVCKCVSVCVLSRDYTAGMPVLHSPHITQSFQAVKTYWAFVGS